MDNRIVGYTNSLGPNNGQLNEWIPNDVLRIVFSALSGSELGNVFLTCTHWTSFRQFCISLATPKEKRILQRYFKFTEEKTKIYDIFEFKKLDIEEELQVENCTYFLKDRISMNTFTLCLFSNKVFQCMACSHDKDLLNNSILGIFSGRMYSLNDSLASMENKAILAITALQLDNLYPISYTPTSSLVIDILVREKFDVSMKVGEGRQRPFYLSKKQGDTKPIGFQKITMDKWTWTVGMALSDSQGCNELIDYIKQFPEDAIPVQEEMKEPYFISRMKRAQEENNSEYLQQVALLMSMLPQKD